MIQRLHPIAITLFIAFGPSLPLTTFAHPISQDLILPEIIVHDQPAEKDDIPIVSTIGGKVPTAIRDIPQSINVINRAVIDAQHAMSLPDTLRNVSGITLNAGEGGSIGNNINLRGFNARTDLYLDGVRDRGQYYRDTFFLESVEVLKGPSSMLFGRGSTGGVINQVSKIPTLHNHHTVTGTVGTHNHYRASADFNQRLSATSALRFNLMAQNIRTTRDVMQNKHYGIAPSLRFGIGTPTEITLSALFAHYRDMPDYGFLALNGKPLAVRADNYYGLTDDRTVQEVATVGARIAHHFHPKLTLRNHLQYSQYKTDVRKSAPKRVGTFKNDAFTPLSTGKSNLITDLPLSALSLQYLSQDRIINDKSFYNQTDIIARFKTGFVEHTLISGLELAHEIYRHQNYQRSGLPVGPVLHPIYQATPKNSVSTPDLLLHATAKTVAVYANDTLALNKHWKFVVGLRQDWYRATFKSTYSKESNVPSFARQAVAFTSVRAGTLYQPNDMQSYYLAIGTSFNPSLETLLIKTRDLLPGDQVAPPQKNRSIEIGTKWHVLDDHLLLTGALFQIEKTNMKRKISDDISTLDGKVRVKGLELSAIGRLTPRWHLTGGYTLLDAKIVKAAASEHTEGKILQNTPRHSATLWATYQLTPAWTVSGGMTYMSNRYANNMNIVSLDNYLHWDASVAYHQPTYDIRLNILNLSNRRDYVGGISSNGGRSIPSSGRTMLLSATYKF